MRSYPLYLSMSAAGAFAGTVAFTLNLIYQVQTVGLGPLQLILVGTVMEVVCFVAQIPTGIIADLYSRRLSIIVGHLLMGTGILLWGLVPQFWAILLANAIWGVGAVCVEGAQEAWVADELGEENVGSAFTRGGQVGQAATVVGILAAVGLASISLNLPIVVGGAVSFGLGLALIALMKEHNFQPVPAGERGSLAAMRSQAVAGGRAVRSQPVLLPLFGALFFIAFSSEGIDRLSQPHLLANFTFPAAGTPLIWFGALGIGGLFAAIAVTELIRRRVANLAPGRVGALLAAFQAVQVVSIVAFALAGNFWLAAFASLVAGGSRAVFGPLFGTWIVARTESATRATVFSMAGQMDAAGQITGGPPIGYLGERFAIRAALVATGLILAPAVWLLGTALRREGREPPADVPAVVIRTAP